MNFSYRKATEADRPQYLDFANMVFSCAHRPHDFQAMIPKVYGTDKQTAHFQNIAVDEKGGIRGLVAVMPGEMRVMGETLRTGYVGTVSVHPYARGEGHMKKLMAMAIDGMVKDGADLAMLGGQRQRYEYFGFTKGGIARYHTVSEPNVRHALGKADISGIAITPVEASDSAALDKIMMLFDSKPSHAVRKPEDYFVISRTWYSALKQITKNGDFIGYMIMNPGEKHADIMELMLTDYALTGAVIKAMLTESGDSGIDIQSSDFDVKLRQELTKFEEDLCIKDAQQLHIFNFPKVIGAFMKLKASYTRLEAGVRSFDIGGQKMTVRVEGCNPVVTAEAGAGAASLTAMEAQTLFFGMDGELTGDIPYSWTHLPLYIDRVDEF